VNINITEISKKLQETIEKLGYFFIDIEFKGDDRNRILEIYIDSEEGINTDDCVDVSRACGNLIEEENLIESKYRLDISSPGTERPLKFIQQYNKHIGRIIELEFEDQVSEKFQFKLKEVKNDILKFEIDNKIEEVKFNNIKSAKIIVRF
jgi:ribosome maturation factor RimP